MSFCGFPLPGQVAENCTAKASGEVKDEPARTVAPAAERPLKLQRTSLAIFPGCSGPWDPEDPGAAVIQAALRSPGLPPEASSPGSLGSVLLVTGCWDAARLEPSLASVAQG